MKRINVTFHNETMEKLEARAEKNGGKSIANDIRDLVDLALRIEESASQNDGVNFEESIKKLINLMKKELEWTLEIRLLARSIIERLPEDENQSTQELWKQCQSKAIDYVEGMIDAHKI